MDLDSHPGGPAGPIGPVAPAGFCWPWRDFVDRLGQKVLQVLQLPWGSEFLVDRLAPAAPAGPEALHSLWPHGSSRSLGAGSASASPRLQSHVKIVVVPAHLFTVLVSGFQVGIRYVDFHLMHSHAQVHAQGRELSYFHPVYGYVRPRKD